MSVNQEIGQRIEQIALMLELLGEDRFRINAHARAARIIGDLTVDLGSLADDKKKLVALEGIGSKIADKIIEYCQSGTISEHAELLERVPAGLFDVLAVPGLGPKTVKAMWDQLDVTDVAGLKKIIADGSILELPRMGAKTVENLKASLAFAEASGDRLWLGVAMPIAEMFVGRMRKVEGVKDAAFAGSLRRGQETIGDIDILVSTMDATAAGEAFRGMPEVRQVLAAGQTKSSVRVRVDQDMSRWKLEGGEGEEAEPGVQVDLRVVEPGAWGATLMYFTGSKEHNVRMRERAIRMGFTLNEYGLFVADDEEGSPQSRGVKPVAAKTEEQIFKKLDLPYIPPELRQDRGELELTETPALIEVCDVQAELHAHTTASDGGLSIEELAEHAKVRGFHTVTVTDHSKSSVQANGLSVDRLMEHIEAVREVDAKMKGIKVLCGSEVDILADGRLDYDDDVLEQLDVVVVSPHTALKQDPETSTKRLIKAISNKYVHILGHPTGRLLNRRPGMSPDIGAVIAAAVKHDVALEINSHWMRLDLRDTHVRAAVEGGALIAIDCDVHGAGDFDNLRYGILTGRRGGLMADRCINTWSAGKLHGWLKGKKA